MADVYFRVFERLPDWLQRRIHPLEFAIREIVRGAAARGCGLVIDAGAGESRFKPYFGGWRYLAVDRAVGNPDWDYSRLDLLADLRRIPVASGVANLVVSTQVLEHVAEPAEVLGEFCRVLKPGGELCLTAPQGWHEHQQPHDYFRFTRFSLARMLEGAGFAEWEIRPIGGYFNYLGHRLTYLPKILFFERSGPARWLLFPLEFVSLGLFCGLFPLLCNSLDRLDRKKEFTLGYHVRAFRR